jgi:hypothetical protein
MEKEKLKVVLNNIIVNKLESINYDIKYYININASIAQSLVNKKTNSFMFIDDTDVEELIKIRKSIKKLVYNLKNKQNTK